MASLPHHPENDNSAGKAISVAIIGGGIAGLSLALGLLKHSQLDVQVYEAAPTFSEIGAGVAIGTNAARALALIGPVAKQAFDKHATGNLWSSYSDTYSDYRVGVGEKKGTLICAQKVHNGMQSVHRAHFLDELVQGVPAQRAHFNKRLKDLKETEDGVTLYFKDGTSASANVAIGADGVHSVVREFLVGPDAAKPVFSGSVLYRGLVPIGRAIEALGSEHAQNGTILCGPKNVAVSYPINDGNTLNIAVFDTGHEEWPHEKWILPAKYEELAKMFKGWGEPTQNLIKLLDIPTLSAWAIFDTSPAPYFYKDRVAMIGDAAHATTPFQAQGAGQAIEDACVLSALFEKVTKPEDVPKALAAYDQVRRPRAQRVVKTSRESGQLMSMQLPGVGGDLEKMREKLNTRMHWIWNRDLVAQNEDAVRLFEEAL